jgi:hypothetical protein
MKLSFHFSNSDIRGKHEGGIMMHKEKIKEKEIYETPDLEIVEFELEDSSAASGNFGPDTICGGEF